MKDDELHEVGRLIDALFQRSRAGGTDPLSRETNDGGEVLLPGVLYRFRMKNNNSGKPVLLQIYRGLAGVGGQFWEQEARALLHLSSLEHPGLPRVVEGGFFEEEGVGYMVTESARYTLAAPNVMHRFREPPHGFRRALRQLLVLSDALVQLHARGLMHRALGPAAIEVVTNPRPEGEGMDLRLARFEMSVLISSLARRIGTNRPTRLDQVRALYRHAGLQTILCCPPERLTLLYGASERPDRTRARDTYEDSSSDVYGLAVLAYQWFVELIPEQRLAAIFLPDSYDDARLSSLLSEMRLRLRRSTDLPGILTRLLLRMLDPDRRQRATSAEVVEALAEHSSATIVEAPTTLDRPLLLSVSAKDFISTRVANRLEHPDTSSDEGWRDLNAWLQEDLKGCLLSFSQEGFKPFRPSKDPELAQAQYVLRGKSFAYFARPFYRRDPADPFSGQEIEERRALQLRYVLDLSDSKARHLDQKLHKRRLPRVEIERFEIVEEMDLSDRPSWDSHLQAVMHERVLPSWQPLFEEALRFILEVDHVRLLARHYPFRRHPDTPGHGKSVRLLLDTGRDRKHLDDNSLLKTFAQIRDNRPQFGDFFGQLDSARREGVIYWKEGERTREDQGRGLGFLLRKVGMEEIEIQRRPDAPIVPELGWLQPAEDSGTYNTYARQRWAVEELLQNQQLLGQLHSPSALMRLRNAGPDVGKGLEGNAGKIVEAMLNYLPFYAVHGPPGTGKTTVTARAVESTLRQDRSQRILVSAQSHESLDNISARILDSFAEGEILATRIATVTSEGKVSARMRRYLPQEQAELRVRQISERCAQRLEDRWLPASLLATTTDDPERAVAAGAVVRRILGEWRAQAEPSVLEIQDRLRRGANLVFATCLTATARYLAAESDRDLFDWVIVEEAAKAWPTELAIPLVRGLKWTLIGDHRQLPAFGREEMEALLKACQTASDEDVKSHYANRTAYIDVFDLFRNLFKERPKNDGGLRPLGQLERQFRMREPIAELVRGLFYKVLETHPSTEVDHGLDEPAALAGKCLVWCDTQKVPGCSEEFGWKNPGEARVVHNLLRELQPNPILYAEGTRGSQLVVLTPYNDQLGLLRNSLPSVYGDFISTIDSFQGKEADIVIVSLVRENENTTATGRLGHLAKPQRVNVMLSRARRLLVLVGNLRHFEKTGDALWSELIKSLRRLGHVIPAHDLMDDPTREQWSTSLGEAAGRRSGVPEGSS